MPRFLPAAGFLAASLVAAPCLAWHDVKNILQAIGFNREDSRTAILRKRPLPFAGCFYTLGDIHQPLHASVAFSVRVLEPEHTKYRGDGGGNAIRLAEKGSLHAVWDAAPNYSPDAVYDKDGSLRRALRPGVCQGTKQIEPLLADAGLNAEGKRRRPGKRPQAMGRRKL